MANQSVVTFEKPLPHISLTNWHSRLTNLKNVATVQRKEAFELRHSSRTLRNETQILTEWDTTHNHTRLADRVAELERWLVSMNVLLARVEAENKKLCEEKALTEADLDALALPLATLSECLSMRDNRVGSEITYDEADDELKLELGIVENNQKIMRQHCQKAWEKINVLNEVIFKLKADIEDKGKATTIDQCQLNIDSKCASITYKPNALRVPTNASTYNGWLENCRALKLLAENELEMAYQVRESLFTSREMAKNLLKAQQEKTEHTLRKRIFETQRSKNELDWQQKKTKEEMKRCIDEIGALENALSGRTMDLKLVETRLENRTLRPGVELCCDEPFEGLREEVRQLRETRRQLIEKLNAVKTKYNALSDHALRLDIDLDNKQQSLTTDLRAMDVRSRLKPSPISEVKTQTDRNITLTRMEDELAKC